MEDSFASAFFARFSRAARSAQDPASIQLVGTFNGITCEPNDPANDMEPMGNHVWRKLKFINEPGDPDTIFFKFTRDGSYLPKHWGWSGVWGDRRIRMEPAEHRQGAAGQRILLLLFQRLGLHLLARSPRGKHHRRRERGQPRPACPRERA